MSTDRPAFFDAAIETVRRAQLRATQVPDDDRDPHQWGIYGFFEQMIELGFIAGGQEEERKHFLCDNDKGKDIPFFPRELWGRVNMNILKYLRNPNVPDEWKRCTATLLDMIAPKGKEEDKRYGLPCADDEEFAKDCTRWFQFGARQCRRLHEMLTD